MTSTALEADPYLLPMPGPDTPVVPGHLIVGSSRRSNARYREQRWPLDLLTANPSAYGDSIIWSNCPDAFQPELRLAAWNLINGELRPTFVRDRRNTTVRGQSTMRQRLGISQLKATVTVWMNLAGWLEARGVDTLAGCDADALDDYIFSVVDAGYSRSTVGAQLTALTRLWAFDQLSAAPSGVGKPRWEDVGVDDYLPPETSAGGENSTEPLGEATLGPLLVWAMRTVDDFADDILSAWAEQQRLVRGAMTNPRTPAGYQALEAWLGPLIDAGQPLPTIIALGKPGIARRYIAGTAGATGGQVDKFMKRVGGIDGLLSRGMAGPAPLATPIGGRIGGVPWRGPIDFTEAKVLMQVLGTAAFIVIAYLTGMRPGEVLGLRSGCCPDPDPVPDGGPRRHLIRGNVYKTATDEDGNHVSAGVERDVPWVAITPVVNAVRVLERLVPEGALLFDSYIHDYPKRENTGALKKQTVCARIERFVAFAYALAAEHGLDQETIPPDPHGNIGTGRFRRTLAWHIARRPGGLVALAVQYGHMRTTVSGAYASRGRGGIDELLDVETVRAVADTVAGLRDDLEAGGGLSGPAARHAIKTAVSGPFYAGVVITATTARRLAANGDVMLYDNPNAFLLCRFRREQALCQREGTADAPRLDRCRPECGNAVRTDRHAAALRARADVLDLRAAHAPGPVGDRLRRNTAKLRAYADHHDRTRITIEEFTA